MNEVFTASFDAFAARKVCATCSPIAPVTDSAGFVERAVWSCLVEESGQLLSVHRDDDVVRAVGEVDASTCSQLDEVLHTLDGAQPALVDLSEVTFMDSSGLRVLIEHHYLRADNRGRLVIVNPSRPVGRLLEVTGLDAVLYLAAE